MRTKIFLRRNTGEYLRLGSKRSKLQKWRRPKGRDNKMRLKEKGRPRTVELGYKQDNRTRGKIDGKDVHFVQNIEDMKGLHKDSVVLLGRMGARKKVEIAKIAKEKNLKVINFSFGLFAKKQEKKKEHATKEKESKIADKKEAKK